MSEFNIEDLDAVIARSREGSLAQMLALQLKGQIRKSGQLAAENVELKQYALDCVNAVENWNSWADKEDQIHNDMETPATDRIVAGIKADGVEEFVEKCREKSKQAISSDIRDNWWLAGEHADDFAKQLREGKSEEVKS